MFKGLLGFILVSVTLVAQANVVISGTRVIYPSDKKSISVELTNKGELPSLVQSWIDNGNEKADPSTLKLPFVITPPVSRIEPQKQQIIRVNYTGKVLANDRETLFFLNVLDIPPKPNKAELERATNYLQFSVRNRLKLFFRPSNLPYPVQDAYNKVTWTMNGNQLTVNNPTPYFITYNKISIQQGNKTVGVKNADMVAPFSHQSFSLNGNSVKGQVHWSAINDFGGQTQGISSLQ